jgi:hypothetical protein
MDAETPKPLWPVSDIPVSRSMACLEVDLRGRWLAFPTRCWDGVATGTEPFVAIVFIREGATVWWCKSERWPAGALPAEAHEVRLNLTSYDASGEDVQVLWLVGGGQRRRRLRVPSSYRPEIPPERRFRTGVVERFATVGSEISGGLLELLVLFVARRDVRSSRNGLWRLRPKLADEVRNESLRRVLTYGRTGVLTAGPPQTNLPSATQPSATIQ